jgi:hypothetical protein
MALPRTAIDGRHARSPGAAARRAGTAPMLRIRRTVLVAAPQVEAFQVFTAGLGQWWPPVGQPQPAPVALMERGVGGRWYERGVDGVEHEWGRVLAWDPPAGLALSWQIGADGDFDPRLQTEVRVSFTALLQGSTLVSLEHGHLERYGGAAQSQWSALDSDAGWIGILEHFAQHCAAVAEAKRGGPGPR